MFRLTPIAISLLLFSLILLSGLRQTESTAPASKTPPGASPRDAALDSRLGAALIAKGPDYVPRTEHRHADGSPIYTNRLILEDSPYLIQHAHNPVDWHPWGAEAFDKARRQQKPVFLSIGYSTCHWCHVMEGESFDDEGIAQLLNEHFVAIKVDREQRPDIDDIYMTAVQMITGRGGWPMSSFLTPEGKPFYGGTYFPRETFATLLNRVNELWHSDRDRLVADASEISRRIDLIISARGEAANLGDETVAAAVAELLDRHDGDLGGFGGAPKFPNEPDLLLLLQYALRTGDAASLVAVETSLQAMAEGGIHDQIGGGFHRYSTDARWLVPHFEKMLYNQAHLARVYVAAFDITGNPSYARVARQILDYVLREMTSEQGAFYSATDADSEGREGEFFVWTRAEMAEILNDSEQALAVEIFGVTDQGNFEGKNILFLPLSLERYAAEHGIALGDLLASVDVVRETLWQARQRREPPLRDDKVITAWNGMMITALAEASKTLDQLRYLEAARRAADFLWQHLRTADGDLRRISLHGSVSVAGTLEDYAYLAEALVALYDATGERRRLEQARTLADTMLQRFWDVEEGGFFLSDEDTDPYLISRPKSPYDGAIPAANSVAARVLVRLAARTGDPRYRSRADATLAAFSGTIARQPSSFPYLLLAADELRWREAGRLEIAAGGNLVVNATVDEADARRIVVDLAIEDGWHVNAHEPLQKDLIPTVLRLQMPDSSWRLGQVDYPKPDIVRLGFQDEPLAVYQGSTRLVGELIAAADAETSATRPFRLDARLEIQACNDQLCLQPEEIRLEIPIR